MSRYVLSAKAQADLKDIWNYSADQWGIDQADRYIGNIRGAVEAVAENPGRGRRCDAIRAGHFRILVGSHVVFYRQVAGEVAVVRILHQHMDFARHV